MHSLLVTLITLAIVGGMYLFLGWQGMAGAFITLLLIEGSFRIRYGFWRPDRM